MPRARVLRKVLQHTQAPQPVVLNTAPAQAVAKKIKTVPEPENYSPKSQTLHKLLQQDIAAGRPHFPIGGKEVYFPWSPITLLRPSAKMTPYQAQFQVPRTFNKLDLRDYLWHVYGLRALNITTQIKWSQWHRQGLSRYRTPQVKKMIIEMEQPFLWPAIDDAAEETHQKSASLAFANHEDEMSMRQGSDLKKPTKAFDGILGPYPQAPRPFVTSKQAAVMANEKKHAAAQANRTANNDLIRRFTKL